MTEKAYLSFFQFLVKMLYGGIGAYYKQINHLLNHKHKVSQFEKRLLIVYLVEYYAQGSSENKKLCIHGFEYKHSLIDLIVSF